MRQIKTTSRNQQWSVHLRSRVGDTISHLDTVWINTTGKNSEPSVGDDWLLVDSTGGGTVSAYKQEFISTGVPLNISVGARAIMVTINDVPTFNFSQLGTAVTVVDAIVDDRINIYGTIDI